MESLSNLSWSQEVETYLWVKVTERSTWSSTSTIYLASSVRRKSSLSRKGSTGSVMKNWWLICSSLRSWNYWSVGLQSWTSTSFRKWLSMWTGTLRAIRWWNGSGRWYTLSQMKRRSRSYRSAQEVIGRRFWDLRIWSSILEGWEKTVRGCQVRIRALITCRFRSTRVRRSWGRSCWLPLVIAKASDLYDN